MIVLRGKRMPVWNEEEREWDERPRNIEEYMELRRNHKRLEDCELPAEFRLLHARPKQYWVGAQLRWGFCLAWAQVDGAGRRGVEEFFHVARYEPNVADEIQMRWAIDDFSRELGCEDRIVEVRRPKVQVLFSMKVASQCTALLLVSH